ncbi:uncharacterized protein [Clytia hemisphaerica]|uniref:Uncharacterized protein n=1 Tax=Clytia hemisphaerica TaxID=252671 RepID=A0A7M5UZL9_9CNID|eukprot:TCONS_00011847-protein
MSNRLGPCPDSITKAFTEPDDDSYGDYKMRCLVRYRVGNEEWKIFWERSRKSEDDIKLERDYENWEEDDDLNYKSSDGISYILRRLDLVLTKLSEETAHTDADDNNEVWKNFQGSSFRSDRYSYEVEASVMHYHYDEGKIVSVKPDDYKTIICSNPGLLLLNGEDMLTFYNPVDVMALNDEEKKFEKQVNEAGKVARIVTLELNGRSFKYDYEFENYWDFRRESYNAPNRMEVELYFNKTVSFRPFLQFVKRHPNVMLHIKYANTSSTTGFDFYNNNPGYALFFTSFTSADWKVFNKYLAKLHQLKRNEWKAYVENVQKMLEGASLETPGDPFGLLEEIKEKEKEATKQDNN